MGTEILLVGNSGTGKSSSVASLNPKETFIINVGKKAFPFRGWKASYLPLSKDNPSGNYYSTDISNEIINTLKYISDKRPEIKQIVIDDFGYSMVGELMRRSGETGFKKFSDIANNAWSVISMVKSLRDDLTVIFMMHMETELDSNGNRVARAKTVGKMIDNTINLEGLFTIVLYSNVEKKDDKLTYQFLTQNDGANTCKSPKGMFEEYKIPNDLQYVINKVHEYQN